MVLLGWFRNGFKRNIPRHDTTSRVVEISGTNGEGAEGWVEAGWVRLGGSGKGRPRRGIFDCPAAERVW